MRVPGGETQRARGRRAHLVQLLVELAELGHLLHHLLPHEEGGVDGSVALGAEALQGVLDQGLLQEHQGTLRDKGKPPPVTRAPLRRPCSPGSAAGPGSHLKEVAPAPRDDGSLLSLVTVHHHHQVHVGILLPAAAVTPDPLHLVVHILHKDKGQRPSPVLPGPR